MYPGRCSKSGPQNSNTAALDAYNAKLRVEGRIHVTAVNIL